MSIAQNFPEIKPSLNLDFANTKKLDDRVTFARASEARYYDGVTTAKAEENLVLYSQEFENAAWLLSGASRTANSTTAPDGTNTADKLIEDSSTSVHAIYQAKTVIATTHTASVYMKESERSWGFLQFSTGQLGAYFDLTNGVVGTVSAGFTASIQSVNNGWYRCSITTTTTSASWTFAVLTATGDGVISYTGDGTSGIFIWGAQLEQRSSVTAYTPTTTQPITNYIPTLLSAPANTARFDHNPVTGESLGLLVEEQRTNLLSYSEDQTQSIWVEQSNVTKNVSQTVSPANSLNAGLVVPNTVSGYHALRIGPVSVTSGVTYSFSIYVKSYGYTRFRIAGTSQWTSATDFFVNQGDPVGNGFYRHNVNLTATTTSASASIDIVFLDSGGTVTHAGNGFSGLFLWGAQVEAGAFPTSYIKTEASQVTRSADSASMTGANFSEWYRADEGSLVFDIADPKKSLNNQPLIGFAATGQSVSANSIALWASSGTALRYRIAANGAYTVDYSGNTYSGGFYALSYKVNDSTLVRNGASITTDTTCSMPSGIDTFNLIWESRTGNTTIKKISYYPARLTNTQLQALTS